MSKGTIIRGTILLKQTLSTDNTLPFLVVDTDGTIKKKDNIDSSNFLTTTLTSGNIIVGNVSDVATGVAMTGDVVISNAGVTTIQSGKITNLKISTTANIIWSKMLALASNRVAVTDGSGVMTASSTTSTDITSLAGLGALGASNKMLGVNNGATALEYKTVSNGLTAGSTSLKLGGALTADTTISGLFALNLTTNSFDFLNSGTSVTFDDSQIAQESDVMVFVSDSMTLENAGATASLGISSSGLTLTGSIGFYGTSPIAKQTSGANLTNNVTSGGTDDTIANYTDLSTYTTDAAAIRNNIYQLARKIKQINDGLRAYGLFT